MPTPEKKHAFAERLKRASARGSEKVGSTAELALRFNLQTIGGPISAQAVHKWLTGTAVPTLDKIEASAAWLDIPLQWLRFGIPELAGKYRKKRAKTGDMGALTAYGVELIARLWAMPEIRRRLIMDLAEQLSLDGEMWTS